MLYCGVVGMVGVVRLVCTEEEQKGWDYIDRPKAKRPEKAMGGNRTSIPLSDRYVDLSDLEYSMSISISTGTPHIGKMADSYVAKIIFTKPLLKN